MPETLIENIERRFARVKKDGHSWRQMWRSLRDHYEPRAGLFIQEGDHAVENRGRIRNRRIRNGKPIIARRRFDAGISTYLCSPAERWYRFGIFDDDLMKFQPVKAWFHKLEVTIRKIFAQSNFYGALHSSLKVNALYGTAAPIIEFHPKKLINCRSTEIGEIYLEPPDDDGLCRSVIREYRKTVYEIMAKWPGAASDSVKNLYDRGDYTVLVEIGHIITPNDRLPGAPKTWPVTSIYWEVKSRKILSIRGYEEMPIMPFRWEKVGCEPYGVTSPGWNSLGDVAQLYDADLMRTKATEKHGDPPLQGPVNTRKLNLSRGAMNEVNQYDGKGVRSVYDFLPNLEALRADRIELQERIEEFWFNDVFQMFGTMNKRERMVVAEAESLRTEQLLQLGNMVGMADYELFNQVFERVLSMLMRLSYPSWNMGVDGILPIPPQELFRHEIQTTYSSTLHRALEATKVNGIMGLTNFVMSIAPMDPAAVQLIRTEELVWEMAETYGVPPKAVVGPNEWAEMKRAEAEKMERNDQLGVAEKTAEIAKTGTEAAKNMSVDA